MTIMTEQEAKKILEKVMKMSKADSASATISGSSEGNIRYARNTVTTSGVVNNVELGVQSNFGKRTGTATVNEFDDASLEKVVRRSEELARLAPENPEAMPPVKPQKYPKVKGFFESTASLTPQERAKAAGDSIIPAKKAEVIAAGFLTDTASFTATANSEGVFAYYPSTNTNFTVTMRTEDGTGSGWVQRDYSDYKLMDTKKASKIAIDKAVMSQEAKAIEPGKYTVILEPDAVVGLLGNMMFAFDARGADEGRTFLSKQGGGNKLGEKVFDERVTLYSDPTDPEVPTQPWDGELMPRDKVFWVKKGVVQNLMRNRFWAGETKSDVVPQPGNLIMEGGDKSLDELIKNTKRGILVTRLWYIRSVDPQTQLYTGLTRDGTFLIENGKIKHPVKNFRFNESPVIMLNNIEDMGKPMRTNAFGQFAVKVPPIKVRDFTFSSLSDAV